MPGSTSMEWISGEDRKWVREHYPELAFREETPLVLAGTLKFDMLYDPQAEQYVINPEGVVDLHGERIKDSYEIEVRFEMSQFSSLPQVYERGGRVERVAHKHSLKIIDMHFNVHGDVCGAACLCLKMEEGKYLPEGFKLCDYFQNLLIPFFYAQSYFEKHNRWPWGEYSHEDLGYLEGYESIDSKESVLECVKLLKKYPRWAEYEKLLKEKGKLKIHRHYCFCRSGRKIRKCHPRVFQGLCKLKEDIETLGVEI